MYNQFNSYSDNPSYDAGCPDFEGLSLDFKGISKELTPVAVFTKQIKISLKLA